MKKLAFCFIAVSLLLVGCTKEEQEVIEDIPVINDKVENVENSKIDKEIEVAMNINRYNRNDKIYTKALNEYGETWETYYEKDYKDFTLKTSGKSYYFTGEGRDILGVKIGDSMNKVQTTFGEPLKSLQKGNNLYDVQSTENLMYEIDGKYVTFFFDKHRMYILRSVLIIPKNTENKKDGYYGKNSRNLLIGFEDLMVELINETRVENGLEDLIYDRKLNEASRLHSKDMVVNEFFSHTGSDGSSAKDRIERFGYQERMYGENIAYGQYSSIHAHEELMNSLGHRENILNKDFTHVSVGVETNSDGVPFYTINFYTR